jgi:hypothetical protein
MTVNDILDLIRAGYTKADIEAMEAAPTPAPAEVPAKPAQPAAQPAADPKPAQPAQPAAEAQPAEAPADPVLAELKAMREQMNKLSIAQGAAKIPDKDELMKTALEKLIGG